MTDRRGWWNELYDRLHLELTGLGGDSSGRAIRLHHAVAAQLENPQDPFKKSLLDTFFGNSEGWL